MTRHTFVALAAIFAALLPAPRTLAQGEDRWYEIWIEGARSGWSHESESVSDGRIVTRGDTRLAIRRGDVSVEIRTDYEFVETEDGQPIEMRTSQALGGQPVKHRYVFEGDEVRVTTEQQGRTTESTVPRPGGEWLTPAAAGRYLEQRMASGPDRIVVRMLDVTTGLRVVEITRTGFAEDEIELLGERVPATRCDARVEGSGPVPVVSVEHYDAAGSLLRSETNLGIMTMTMLASDRARALVDADPAELMVSTFVKPDRAISRPRHRERAVFVLSMPGGEMPEPPASAYQSSEMIDASSARITVDLGRTILADETDPGPFLASTTYASTEDALIRELTERALRDIGEEPAARAEALRRFVFRHIDKKDLATAFATASETARSCAGDCSEHGVLLAAMLRAAGIPSRVVAGVVYVERFGGARNVFGYHMWTQALLETGEGSAWVDLDATLNDSTPFDATHIAFAASALADGDALNALTGISPMLGTLEIRVEEIR